MPTNLTITLVAYNEEKYISDAIESILKQSYKDFYLRIYNHASTDRTGEIADQFACKDPRVSVIHLALNDKRKTHKRVVDEVDTPFWMWAAGHDLYDPRYIELCMQPLLQSPSVVLSYPRAAFFREGQVTGLIPGNFNTQGMDPLSRPFVVGFGLVYCYQYYGIYRHETVRRLRESTICVGADHVVLAELALLGEFAEVPEVLFYMRQLGDFGNQSIYIKKHHSQDSQSGIYQFLKTAHEYMRIADGFSDEVDKDLMKLAFFTQTLIRNRNILEMYGEDVHSFFADENVQDLRKKVADLVGAVESKFAAYGIETN